MEVALLKKQKIISVIFITLGFFVLGLVPFSKAYAQPVIITETDDIKVTASVPGCGDNYVQTSLGEQCEGPNALVDDLNGQTCFSLGFETGILECRDTCIFDTSSCTGTSNSGNTSSGGSGSKKSSFRKISEETEIANISNSNLIFSGRAGPGDVIVILNGNIYFASGIADSNGNFDIVVSDFKGDTYNFNFYATSQQFGKSIPLKFKAIVKENTTTQISNINLLYPDKTISTGVEKLIEEKINPLFDVLLVNVIEPERPIIPYTIVFVSGFALFWLIRFLIFLARRSRRRYINHYEK